MTSYRKISTLLLLILVCSSCSNGLLQSASNSTVRSAFTGYEITQDVMGKWSRSCALCHVNGEAGAPVLGDSDAWRERIAQGEEVVMNNVLNGVNSMPPLGYCMACELDDFRALIGYMAGTSP